MFKGGKGSGKRQEQGQGQEGQKQRKGQEQEWQAVADSDAHGNSGTSASSVYPDPEAVFCPISDSGGLFLNTAPWANMDLEDFGSVFLLLSKSSQVPFIRMRLQRSRPRVQV